MPIVSIEQAIKELKNQEVVALPTETVYGLAGKIDSSVALAKIFATKKRPFFDPLIVHVTNFEQASFLWDSPPKILEILAQKFWPGPLTLIFKKSSSVLDLITSGLDTVAIRSPQHPVFQGILKKINIPLAAPSANIFTKTSPTEVFHVLSEFDVPVVDGGKCSVGIESTILEVSIKNNVNEITIRRPGKILASEIADFLKAQNIDFIFGEKNNSKNAPGNFKHHYMPEKSFFLITKDQPLPLNSKELVLEEDPIIVARNIYADLRSFSKDSQISSFHIFKDKYPQDGHWLAIWERLEKAKIK
jgi:L-threonylcarbamoyladenylate synthase